MDADNTQILLRPLLQFSPAIEDRHEHDNLRHVSSNSSIGFRLSLVILAGFLSIWANHEASKGFSISIVNESDNQFSAKRFDLFYVSNDEATNLVLRTSKSVEDYLYPDIDNHRSEKKEVNHVILKLRGRNSTNTSDVVVEQGSDSEFVVSLSPSVMEGTDFRNVVFRTVQRGMVRVWIWDGRGEAPEDLVNGVVEYITGKLVGPGEMSEFDSGDGTESSEAVCWMRGGSKTVAGFLHYCERRQPGFVRRLNQAMKDGWGWWEDKVDGSLDLPMRSLCTAYDSLRYNYSSL